MPGEDWIEGQSVLLERTSSWMEDKGKVVAQNDGSKTPSPGGGV